MPSALYRRRSCGLITNQLVRLMSRRSAKYFDPFDEFVFRKRITTQLFSVIDRSIIEWMNFYSEKIQLCLLFKFYFVHHSSPVTICIFGDNRRISMSSWPQINDSCRIILCEIHNFSLDKLAHVTRSETEEEEEILVIFLFDLIDFAAANL